MHFYPHNIADFNNATRHLTRVERSVYRDATERYYDTEVLLTKDISLLERKLMCRTDEEKEALKAVLAEFFIEKEDGYFHERCEAEIEKYRANSTAKARAGKASAEARKKKREQKSTGVEQVLDSVQQTNNQELITNNQELNKKRRFTPPSLKEVTSYCQERKNQVDPQSFIDHYEANGWMRGKNKIKDWKACVRTWEKNSKSESKSIPDKKNPPLWFRMAGQDVLQAARELGVSTIGKQDKQLHAELDQAWRIRNE